MASNKGTTTVDFGAFPGKTDATVSVADATIGAASQTEAYLYPVATADHSADEHVVMMEKIGVCAKPPTAGVGFDITCVSPDNPGGGTPNADGIRLYGLWTIAWVWTD